MKTAEYIGLGIIAAAVFARRRVGVNAIYPQIPNFYECADGTFSTSSGRSACRRHGGKKSPAPVELGQYSRLLDIQDVPIEQIKTNTKLFQGRDKEYSERSVMNILADVQGATFVWENLDPVTLWRDDAGNLYPLSGHSRLEAFKRLAKTGATAQGKTFDRIPAKILRNVPVEVAQKVALESNTLSTKETDTERAQYYRRLRQDGTKEAQLRDMIKKNEGRNWTNIYPFTFLNPDGKTWAALKMLGEGEDTSANLAKSIAKWIGQARAKFPMLTNAHENELYDWIFNNGGYGTGSGQVKSELEFLDKVSTLVAKNTFFGAFNADAPLNIQSKLYKSPVEQEFEAKMAEKVREINETEKAIRRKIRELSDMKASKKDIDRIVAPMEAHLRNLRIEYTRLQAKKDEVLEYSKREATLFGIPRKFYI